MSVRLWLDPANGSNFWQRKKGEPRKVIATITVEPGKDRVTSAIVAMCRMVEHIPVDVPLTVLTLGNGLVSIESRSESNKGGMTTSRLYYVWSGANKEPWYLKDSDSYRLLDCGSAVGIGEKQTMSGPKPNIPVESLCPNECGHPSTDHYITETFVVSCSVCISNCGEVE